MDIVKELNLFCEQQVKKNAAPLPASISKVLEKPNQIKAIEFSECDQIILHKEIQQQIGYTELPNGGWYVAVKTPMPNVSKEMFDWWFWWHAQEPISYKMWYPQYHFNNRYDIKDREYFKTIFNRFEPNTQYPYELIGGLKGKLSIQFVKPTQFGFSKKAIKESKVQTILCGHVGLLFPRIQHTEMCHILLNKSDETVLVSRFWMVNEPYFLRFSKKSILNKMLISKHVKSKFVFAERAKDVVEHCYIEYRNLATFLPYLFNKFA